MTLFGIGLIAVGVLGLIAVIGLYRFAMGILEDPDTWKLLDGEESE